jgi:hypothetical protein
MAGTIEKQSHHWLRFSQLPLYCSHALVQTKLRGLSPRANYTDRETAPLVGEVSADFRIEVCSVVGAVDTLLPYFRFSKQEPLHFYQVAPQLYSRG